ncbi:PREDICTED: uncharacterized protein LOC106750437 [Dinoponera quadriceps]|uniref:Uncharacterized protein LOC106750437 n=1 Tax=Dinoponera quadriceps TaxID=609295 RepID=A0A6P3Y8C5_DINQU|nr:PREDICTED: uncharacterized protein LOC106750437 [Dinoponera quadriceps]
MCNVLNGDTMTCDYGVSKVLSKDSSVRVMHPKQQQSVHRQQQQQTARKVGVMGSRRIFPPSFKLKVLHSYRNDVDCRGNQRATARKFGIHRRQIQKWLQCEENLKNCAENGNARPASTTDSSASVSKSESATVTEGGGPAGPAAIPAAPALNLNVARLHGDELTPQQRSPPPASPPHLPRCDASPPTRLRTVPKNMLLQGVLGYSQYSPPSSSSSSSSDRKHHHREAENAMIVQEIHYVDTQVDQDRNYYGDGPTIDVETTSVHSCDRNEIAAHESIRSYYWSSTEHQCAAKDANEAIAHPQHHQQQRHHSPNHCAQTYGNVDLFNRHLHGLIGASLIKTEPASPDSTATSGPYEPAGSPGGQWAPQSPTVSHQVANNSSGSSLPAHFNSTAGPSHVHEHAHMLLVPSTPYSSHQHERESEETTGYAEERGEQKEYCGTVIKEEVDLPEDEVYDERLGNNASPYIDVTGDLSRDTLEDSENAPVEVDDCSASSPGDPGRSSSNSSDSEMGSLDGAPGNQSSPGNLTRRQQLRRSFPLSFKLDVLDAFHKDADVAGNQRATARKFDINRRQVQKWLLKETDLRDEIALRGDSRQRLAPAQELFVDSPIDLRTINYVSSDCSRPSSGAGLEAEYERSPPHHHYYEVDGIPCIRTLYFNAETTAPSVEVEPAGRCILPCCADKRTTTSTTSSSQDLSLRGSYTESPSGLYCYSPKDYAETYSLTEEQPPSSKRQAYSWNNAPSPKRFCSDDTASQKDPSQDRPLCLVKPKRAWLMASRMEAALARSTLSESDASQPSSSTSARDDGILFKPYLDNPVCRPASNDAVQRELSPKTRENIINNNKRSIDSGINDNDIIHYRRIYKTNKNRRLQLNVHLPTSLRPLTNPKADLDHISYGGMNFTRYPAHHETRNSCLFNCLRPYEAQTMGSPHLAINQNGFVITRHPHLIVSSEDSFAIESLCS